MREAFVTISNIPTHVMTWGKWIEESFTKNEKEVVIMLTGNPGLPGFYTQFLSSIHTNLGPDIPVWIIGQAGHDYPPKTSIRKVPELELNKEKFNLDGQLKHKIDFIRKYVPDDVKIHLIGHSIGSWMTLELLKEPNIKRKIKHCYLLFPTIERMSTSPNGQFFMKYVVPYFYWFRLFFIIFSKFPVFLQTILMYFYFRFKSNSIYLLGTGLKYFNPLVIEQSKFLAIDEMERVVTLDDQLIEKNKKILKFYYGTTDGWVPTNYYYELKERFPDIDAELDTDKMEHAFMFSSAVLLGQKLANWIIEKN